MAGILGIYGMIVAVIIVQKSIFHSIFQSQPLATRPTPLMPISPQDFAAASAHW